MAETLSSVIALAFLPVATTAIGATIAGIRPPGPKVRSAVQHFAAGVVFSVVAVELLPDVTRVHDAFEIGWTFAAGVALMLLISLLERRLEASEDETRGATRLAGANIGQLVGVGVDVLLDGLLIGVAFAAGSKQGIFLTVALSLELLSLGVAIASSLSARGASRLKTIAIPSALSLLLVVGAVLGDTVLRGASDHTLAGVLSFGSAALLYLVTEELLVEAHEAAETPAITAMFFAGFLLFLLLGMSA
ncbi:MAG: transporter [Gemmatimonadaceae bacterium]|nr:transporter [Gemmatimonadaceae bacterium]